MISMQNDLLFSEIFQTNYSDMTESQCFLLENSLAELGDCLDEIQKQFLLLHKSKRTPKRMRPITNYHTKFKDNIAKMEIKWKNLFEIVFRFLTDINTYDKLASDIINTLQVSKIRYKVADDHYNQVLRIIVIPLVESIMDDEEVNKESKSRQMRRIHFLDQLLDYRINDNGLIESDDDSVIDVLSEPRSTQRAQVPGSNELNSLNSINSFNSNQFEYQSESILILDILFNTISRQTSLITQVPVNFKQNVTYIINITYIIDLIKKNLITIRQRLQYDGRGLCQGSSRDSVFEELNLAMRRYEECLMKNLNKMDIESPFTIFKKDLRLLLVQVRLILPRTR